MKRLSNKKKNPGKCSIKQPKTLIKPNKPDPPPPKRPRRRRLNTLRSVKLYLANLIHDTRAGEVEASLAGKLGFLLNILRGVINESDMEARIKILEEKFLKNNNHKTGE